MIGSTFASEVSSSFRVLVTVRPHSAMVTSTGVVLGSATAVVSVDSVRAALDSARSL